MRSVCGFAVRAFAASGHWHHPGRIARLANCLNSEVPYLDPIKRKDERSKQPKSEMPSQQNGAFEMEEMMGAWSRLLRHQQVAEHGGNLRL
jgi:hypothetical protein